MQSIFSLGANLLRLAKGATKDFLKVYLTKIILEINISNFITSTIKLLDDTLDIYKTSNNAISISKIETLQRLGVLFAENTTKARGKQLSIFYKGELIASGTGKELKETLKDVLAYAATESKILKALDDLLYRWKFNHIPTSGAIVDVLTKKGSYLVGSFAPDLQFILKELDYPVVEKLNELFPLPSGQKFNLLNVSNEIWEYYTKNGGFFTQVNSKWVDSAVDKAMDVMLMSKKEDLRTINKFDKEILTGFGKEVHRFEWTHGYRFDPKTKMMLPPNKAKGLKPLTRFDEYTQKQPYIKK